MPQNFGLSSLRPGAQTQLGPDEERDFQQWYARWARFTGINPDPDHPLHHYDYRAAYRAGFEPTFNPETGKYHWPSPLKGEGHPNRYVDFIDTITGQPMPIPP
jgi:hypothetical protein